MPFDIKKFKKIKFTDRTETMRFPDLAGVWFEPDNPCEFTIRGLSGMELAAANDAVERNKNLAGMLEAITSTVTSEKVDAVSAALGIDGKAPNEFVKRVEYLKTACVDPVFDHIDAVKFCENFPFHGIAITNKIMQLTGMGRLPGESKPSGSGTTSGQV